MRTKVSKTTKSEREGEKIMRESVWKSRPHYCEECGIFLGDDPAPVYFSHILAKGAFPRFRNKSWNINLLCPKHHREWEAGKRSEMKIFEKNRKTIMTHTGRDIKKT